MIKSWVDRFDAEEDKEIDQYLEELSAKDAHHFIDQ